MKTLGELLCLWTACSFFVDTTGAVVRGGEEKGKETERERRDTEIERQKKERERAAQLPLQSK